MNPELLNAVVDVNAVAESLRIKVVLVGALVLEFTTEIKPDYPQPRRTNDADFAVFADSWKSFNQFRAALEAKHYKRSPKVEHRFANDARTILIDLIPVGSGITKDGKVIWPESEQVMVVIGFPEVCAAIAKEVKPGLPKVPVITVSGFVLLKIIAFQDRFEKRDLKYQNDVEHIAYWFENYASISASDERRFALLERKDWKGLDINCAGAALLGLEVKQLCSAESIARIQKFLKDSIDPDSTFVETFLRLKRSMAEPEDLKALRGEALDWLKAFQRGFEAE